MLGGNETGHFSPGRIRDSNRILTSFRIDEYNRDSQRKLNKDLLETGGTESASACRCKARGRANLFLPGEEARVLRHAQPVQIKNFRFTVHSFYCISVLFVLSVLYRSYCTFVLIVVNMVKNFNLPVYVVLEVKIFLHVLRP